MTQTETEDVTETEEETPQSGRWTRRRTIAAGVACVLVVGAAAGAFVWQRSKLPGDAAMRVDGTVVTKADLRKDVATLRAMYGVEPPQGKEDLEKFYRDSAQASAVSMILDDAAKREGIKIADAQVDQSLAAYVAALYEGVADPQKEFVAALSNAGTSERAVKDEIRRRLTVDALTNKIVAGAEMPTADEVATAFEQRSCTLTVPETREIRNIVVATKDDGTAIVRELRGGASFAAVAKLKSADTSTSSTGGNLGSVAQNQLESAYGQAAFKAKANQVFGPVRTQSGWNIGQVTKITAGRTATLEEVAKALQQQLLVEKQSRVWQDWLKKQIKDADVTYADDYRPKDPNAVPEGIGKWADSQTGACSPGGATQ